MPDTEFVEKIDPMVWFHNFKGSVGELIEAHLQCGYTVKQILVSEKIYRRCTEALGHEPDNILGYTLAVVDFELESDSGDDVAIAGECLN